jgi:hypothetical protein
MANTNAAFGLKPYRMLGSAVNSTGDVVYSIQTVSTAGTSSLIYQGSPVIPISNGMIDIVGNANGGTVPLLGVFMGCNYIDLTGKPKWSPYWPGTAAVKANTAATATIISDPDAVFSINCNAAAADTLIHNNANFASATSGVTTGAGLSSAQLAVSTAATTNTLNLRILGFVDTPNDSDPTVAGRLAIVQLNNHFYRYCANGTGAGV